MVWDPCKSRLSRFTLRVHLAINTISTTEIMAPSILDTQPLAEMPSKIEPKITHETAKHEEYQYLDLIREILESGEHRPDRYLNAGLVHAYTDNL
jgi:hypothetical protein